MKDYIYNRIVEAERMINEVINNAKLGRARDVDYQELRAKVMSPLDIKTMPEKYKDQISAILWFTYKREIHNHFLFPVMYHGRLYSKWEHMPEDCRELLRNTTGEESLRLRPFPVFSWCFKEGMLADKELLLDEEA